MIARGEYIAHGPDHCVMHVSSSANDSPMTRRPKRPRCRWRRTAASAPAGRFKIALELTKLTRRFAIAGIRRRHPEYTEEQAIEALARALHGPR